VGEAKARFIEPMPLLPSQNLPEGSNWGYEVKLDGCRAIREPFLARMTAGGKEIASERAQRIAFLHFLGGKKCLNVARIAVETTVAGVQAFGY
jgi:hypothetical protein